MFSEYGYPVGQLLITKSDVDDDERRHNLINAFAKLFELNVVPIVNENDCVAVEEIVYGDNDCLSAIVAKLVGADKMCIRDRSRASLAGRARRWHRRAKSCRRR